MHFSRVRKLMSMLLAFIMVLGVLNINVSAYTGSLNNNTNSYKFDGELAEHLTEKYGATLYDGELVQSAYNLSDNQLAALNNLLSQESQSGLVGFDDYDLSSSEKMTVIVEFVNRPAAVERAIDEIINGIDTSKLRSNSYEINALADKAIFYEGLADIFGSASTGRPASHPYTINHEYTDALNGVSITVPANKVAELASIESVRAIYPNSTIRLPEGEEVDAEVGYMNMLTSQELYSETDETIYGMHDTREFLGVNELHKDSIKGNGVLVGVIDTGVDYYHPDLKDAFLDYNPRDVSDEDVLIDGKYYGRNLVDDEIFVRSKYDPMESTYEEYLSASEEYGDEYIPWHDGYGVFTTEHGTHVSGEIVGRGKGAAKGTSVLGIAPEANLVVYRVMGAYGTGDDASILAGIDESVKDGCDVVNMSLGVSQNNPYYVSSLAVNYCVLAYNIVFCVAAANNGSGGEGTLGSPSTAALAITVGAISVGYEDITLSANNKDFTIYKLFQDYTSKFAENTVNNVYELTYDSLTRNADGSYNFYVLRKHNNPSALSTGVKEDWTETAKAEAKGKIIIVERGNIYLDTMKNAKEAGAGGVLVIHQSYVNGQTATKYSIGSFQGKNAEYIPFFGIDTSDGNALVAALGITDSKASFTKVENADGVANFSSRGPVGVTYDIKPDVVSPGVSVYSTVPYFYRDSPDTVGEGKGELSAKDSHDENSYDFMSGTSMATPQTAGLVALMICKDMKDNNGKKTLSALEIKARLMNTADSEGIVSGYGVHEMGAGRIHIEKAMNTEAYITADNNYVVIGNYGNNPDDPKVTDATGVIGDRSTGQTPTLVFGTMVTGLDIEAHSEKRKVTIKNESLTEKTFTVTAEFNYAGMSVKNPYGATITTNKPDNEVTVTGGGSSEIEIAINIPEDFLSYGSIEGYVYFKTDDGESYRIPFCIYTIYKGIDSTGEYLGYAVFSMPVISTGETRQMDYSSISAMHFSIVKEFDYVLFYFSEYAEDGSPKEYFGTIGQMNMTGAPAGNEYYFPDAMPGYYYELTTPGMDYENLNRELHADYKYFEPGTYTVTAIAMLGSDMETAQVVDVFESKLYVDNDAPQVEILEKDREHIFGRIYDKGLEEMMDLKVTWPAYQNNPTTDYTFATVALIADDTLYIKWADEEGQFYFDLKALDVNEDSEVQLFAFDYFGPRRIPIDSSVHGSPRHDMSGFDPYAISFASDMQSGYTSPNMTIMTFKIGDSPSVDFDYADETLTMFKGNTKTLVPTLTLIPSMDKLSWESSNTSAVNVDNDGNITAVGTGTATITASWQKSPTSTISGTIDITVVEPAESTPDVSAGVNIEKGAGVYFGTYAYITSTLDFGYKMGIVPNSREEEKTPVLWSAMGEETLKNGTTDGYLTLLSKNTVDYKIFSSGYINGFYKNSNVDKFLRGEFMNGFTSVEENMIPEVEVIVPRYAYASGEKIINDRTYGESEVLENRKVYLPWSNSSDNYDVFWSADAEPIVSNTVKSVLGTNKVEYKDIGYASGLDLDTSYFLRNPAMLHTLLDTEYSRYARYSNRVPTIMVVYPTEPDINFTDAGSYWGVRPVTKIVPESILYAYEVTASGGAGKVKADNYYAVGKDSTKNYKLTVLGGNNGVDIGTLTGGFDEPTVDVSARTLTVANVMLSQTDDEYTVAYKVVDANNQIVLFGEIPAAQVAGSGLIEITNLPDDIAEEAVLTAYFWIQKNRDYNSNESGVVQSMEFVYESTMQTAPEVTGITPANEATDVSASGNITVTFDGSINVEGNVYVKKAEGGEYTVLPNGVLTVNRNDSVSVFTVPYSYLEYNTEYLVKVVGFGRDKYIMEDYESSFTTCEEPDKLAPFVADVSLKGSGVDAEATEITITFNKAMDTGALAVGYVMIYGNSSYIYGSGSWSDGRTYVYSFIDSLASNTAYSVTIANFKDVSGNTMQNYSYSFITGSSTTSSSDLMITDIVFNNRNKMDAEYESGIVTVSFNQTVGTIGTVSINGTELELSANRGDSLDYCYHDLGSGKLCELTVSGFVSDGGAEMSSDYTYQFATSAVAPFYSYATPNSLELYDGGSGYFNVYWPSSMPAEYVEFSINNAYDAITLTQLNNTDFISFDTSRITTNGDSVKVSISGYPLDNACQISYNVNYYSIAYGLMMQQSFNVTVYPAPETGSLKQINLSSDGNGTIKTYDGKVAVKPGQEVMLVPTPYAGYEFAGFETAPSNLQMDKGAYYYFIMPDENVSIKANFVPVSYQLTLSSSNDSYGTVSADPDQSSYSLNDTVTLTAAPKEGYYFAGWRVTQGDVVIAENNKFLMSAEDVTIVGRFEPILYKASVQSGSGGTAAVSIADGIGSSSVTAEKNTEVTFTATPADGYRFKEWQVLSGDVSLGNTASFAVTIPMPNSNITLKAIFEIIPKPIAVTGVRLNRSSLSLEIGKAVQLTATVLPSDAYSKSVFWTSSNMRVAAVDSEGVVTAISDGTAVITVTTTDGGFTASCTVTVYTTNTVTPVPTPGPAPTPTPTPAPTPVPDKDNGSGSGSETGSGSGTDEEAKKIMNYIPATAVELVADGELSATVKLDEVKSVVKQYAGDLNAFITMKVEAANNSSIEDINEVLITIPKEAVDIIASGRNAGLRIETPVSMVSFDSKAIKTIMGADVGDMTLNVTVTNTKDLALSDAKFEKIGDRPVFEFTVTKGKTEISDFDGGKATITLPYTLRKGENPNAIVVYYIDGGGSLKTMRGYYDKEKGNVIVTTTHFSMYAIGYNPVTFSDVPEGYSYKTAIDFIAARGITSGIGNGLFGGENEITRGMFLVMLMKAYDISPDTKWADNFDDANGFYAGYLAAAKRLNLVKGTGNNKYEQDKAISREEMFVMVYNTLKVIGEVPSVSPTAKKASDFADYTTVSQWAKEAITVLVESKTIVGDGSNIMPKQKSTRSQMAQVIYNLMTK